MKTRGHPANETEATGGQARLAGLDRRFPRLTSIWVDAGDKRRFAEWVTAALGWRVDVVRRPDPGRRQG